MSLEPSASDKFLRLVSRTQMWVALLVFGLLVWIIMGFGVDAHRAWRAFLINFLFFSSLAAGMVVWPAVVVMARGRWMGSTEPYAHAGITFAPISIITLVLLWLSDSYWTPWVGVKDLPQRAWLNPTFLFLRDLIGLMIFWILAYGFVHRRRHKPAKYLAGWLILIFCIVFSLLGFDLVMPLYPHWYSSLFGGYFFISAMYIAIGGWTFNTLWNTKITLNQSSDLGKLVFTFSILTTYMMFSQLLPIWYENLPQETLFVIPRFNIGRWKWVSIVLLATIYLGPIVVLLTRWSKRTEPFLRGVALGVLFMMWVERWWLVIPSLDRQFHFGVTEIAVTVAFLAAFVLSISRFNQKIPHMYFDAKEPL